MSGGHDLSSVRSNSKVPLGQCSVWHILSHLNQNVRSLKHPRESLAVGEQRREEELDAFDFGRILGDNPQRLIGKRVL